MHIVFLSNLSEEEKYRLLNRTIGFVFMDNASNLHVRSIFAHVPGYKEKIMPLIFVLEALLQYIWDQNKMPLTLM